MDCTVLCSFVRAVRSYPCLVLAMTAYVFATASSMFCIGNFVCLCMCVCVRVRVCACVSEGKIHLVVQYNYNIILLHIQTQRMSSIRLLHHVAIHHTLIHD